MDNILQASSEGSNDEFEAHTLSITVADVPGVLNHVRAHFALALHMLVMGMSLCLRAEMIGYFHVSEPRCQTRRRTSTETMKQSAISNLAHCALKCMPSRQIGTGHV